MDPITQWIDELFAEKRKEVYQHMEEELKEKRPSPKKCVEVPFEVNQLMIRVRQEEERRKKEFKKKEIQ